MLKTVSAFQNAIGALNYKGSWNASTNTPTLTSGVGNKGDYYVVSVAGSTNLDGTTLWGVGDWCVFNGTIWQKIDGGDTSTVTSLTVTTLTGYLYGNNTSPVTASTTIPVANVTGAVPNTVNILAGTGLSGGGALTANITLANAGVTAFNTRTGNVTLTSADVTTALGYTPGIGNGTVTSVTGTTPISSSGGTTPNISISQANAITNGFLSSTDWTTFNSKQPAGTYVTSVSGTTPIASSGGTTPSISIPAANASSNGYLTSTDWTTFNSKGTGNGSVTNVATGTGLIGGPITTTGTISLANTTVTAGTYGNASTVSQVTIDAQGRITNAVNVAISIANSAVTGLGTMSTQNANAVVITGGTINSVAHSGGTFANANITSVSPTFPNSFLSNSSVTLGNTTVSLGATATSIGNLTLNNVTIPSGSINVQAANLTSTTTANATFATSSLPLVPAGYIQVNLNGTVVKVPYYAV